MIRRVDSASSFVNFRFIRRHPKAAERKFSAEHQSQSQKRKQSNDCRVVIGCSVVNFRSLNGGLGVKSHAAE